ncbi:NUDIX hydrolase [Edaphovirga cremea]|uniref:NUDIX hydrolase n=1 Tax=Edaphovirga cremea TaxID=2267246 RepID=UPI00398A44EB
MSNYVQEMRALVGHRPLLLAGSNVIILNSAGHILLQQRINGCWGLPGGLLELGESLEDTARREVLEETGLQLGPLQFLNVFSGEQYFFTLPNQDQLHVITALYLCRSYTGEMVADGEESLNLMFFPADEIPASTEDEYKEYIAYYKTKLPI